MKKVFKIILTIQAMVLVFALISVIESPNYSMMFMVGFASGVLIYMLIAFPHISYLEKSLLKSFVGYNHILMDLKRVVNMKIGIEETLNKKKKRKKKK